LPAGRLTERTVVITGGASGIGRACAILFAAEGARVCVADRDEAAAARVAAEITGADGVALACPVDVSDRDASFEMVRRCESKLGPVDALVACAGIWSARPPEPDAPLTSVSKNDVKIVLDVNLFGTLFANQAAAASMIEHGRRGSIVNMSSMSAKLARPTRGPYAISKAGVWMMTKVLAVELASRGIRVNALAPGYIDTPMTAAFDRGGGATAVGGHDWLLQRIPMGRAGSASEVAHAALFLASDDSSYFTGELLQPTGGWYIG
jgi:NAD(P)-dependent dehydrogenase (short-subunit alcohol dehydrogenase family)